MSTGPGGGNDDDDQLFLDAMRDVAPLPKRTPARPAAPSPPRTPPPRQQRPRSPVSRLVVEDRNGVLTGRPPGMSRKQLAGLRRGVMHLDDTLDLHGLTAARARTRLTAEVPAQQRRGARCLLLIHGRGHHSTNGVSVLRGVATETLTDSKLAPFVRAFATASPQHGGLGALYLWLAETP